MNLGLVKTIDLLPLSQGIEILCLIFAPAFHSFYRDRLPEDAGRLPTLLDAYSN